MDEEDSAENNSEPGPSIIIKTVESSSDDFEQITEAVNEEISNTAALLYYCQCKIIRPYSRVLCVMGLRPSTAGIPEQYCCLKVCNILHLTFVLVLMCVGYLLQYITCFRRDRGFDYKAVPTLAASTIKLQDHEHVCYDNIVFSYIVPSVLHFSAYIYTMTLFRINDNEQLQNLMERALLVSDGSMAQCRIVHTLWISIGLSILWMSTSLVIVSIMVADGTLVFHWLGHSPIIVLKMLKVLLALSTLWHDMVQATLITSYCLQSQLLSLHVRSLGNKLLQHSLCPVEWMREMCEFRKLLKYLNEDLAPTVCILSIVNISYAASGAVWLLKYDTVDTETRPISGISILNVILWGLIAIAPFIQAARLTSACMAIRNIGHEVRPRPYVYESTPRQDLDSILLYTSSLRMTSKLFKVPVTGRYLCMFLALLAIVVITLGQCHTF
ncbi:uncharacterized protein GrlHz [Periplaneta americana]|uniref:uncharacterized protein GrlHz n=1 Tax=Periplaneta americana TaxID=6978 RepID=UPI0037E9A62F